MISVSYLLKDGFKTCSYRIDWPMHQLCPIRSRKKDIRAKSLPKSIQVKQSIKDVLFFTTGKWELLDTFSQVSMEDR